MLTVNKETSGGRPCLVLAHADEAYALRACTSFRRMGWEVHRADTGAEVRGLARAFAPNLVILYTQPAGERGWLPCAKLTRQTPRLKVWFWGVQSPSQNKKSASSIWAT